MHPTPHRSALKSSTPDLKPADAPQFIAGFGDFRGTITTYMEVGMVMRMVRFCGVGSRCELYEHTVIWMVY